MRAKGRMKLRKVSFHIASLFGRNQTRKLLILVFHGCLVPKSLNRSVHAASKITGRQHTENRSHSRQKSPAGAPPRTAQHHQSGAYQPTQCVLGGFHVWCGKLAHVLVRPGGREIGHWGHWTVLTGYGTNWWPGTILARCLDSDDFF